MFDTFIYYWNVVLAVYKALAIIVTIFSIAGIVYVLMKSSEMRRNRYEKSTDQPRTNLLSIRTGSETISNSQQFAALRDATITGWHKIVERLATQDQKDFKSAIIEADALADAAISAQGFAGETMADRMRAVPHGRLTSMEDLWRAHKVRNAIAHDPHYIVSPREGHDIMRIYKKVLEEFGAL